MLPIQGLNSQLPTPMSTLSVLICVTRAITIPPFSQRVHRTNMALACPNKHYMEVQPWRRPKEHCHALVVDGIYDRRYRGEITTLIANPSAAPIQIQAEQVLAQLAAISTDTIARLSPAHDTYIGLNETPRPELITMSTTTSLDPIRISQMEHSNALWIWYFKNYDGSVPWCT